jgi:NitT/TauT family transport system substrate-binding protein
MMMRSKRLVIVLIAILSIIGIILSLFIYLSFQPPSNSNLESMTLGTLLLEPSIPFFIAQQEGFFTENGLNVTIKYYDTGLAGVNALLKNEVNISSSTGDYVFAGKILQGEPIKAVASHNKVYYDFVVARKDSGISSISDLAGKRIGVIRNTQLEFFLIRFLQLNGINPSSVQLVNMPQLSQTVNAVVNGSVDAVITVPPFVQAAQSQLGDNALVWPAQSNQPLQHLIICRDDWINQNPALVQRFVNAMVQAEQFITSNPTQAKAIAQDKLNLTAEAVEDVWSRNDFTLSLNQPLITALRDEAQFMINNNLTNQTQIPNFVNSIYTDALRAVKPESVNIIG